MAAVRQHRSRLTVRRHAHLRHAARPRRAGDRAGPRPLAVLLHPRLRHPHRKPGQRRQGHARGPHGDDLVGVPPQRRRLHLPLSGARQHVRRGRHGLCGTHLHRDRRRRRLGRPCACAARIDRRGAALPRHDDQCRRRDDLGVRGRRARACAADGRQQRAQPDGRALPGVLRGGRPALPQHPPHAAQRREPVLLRGRVRQGHRLPAHPAALRLADRPVHPGAHLARQGREGRDPGQPGGHRRGHASDARGRVRGRSDAVYARMVLLVEHDVLRAGDGLLRYPGQALPPPPLVFIGTGARPMRCDPLSPAPAARAAARGASAARADPAPAATRAACGCTDPADAA